MKYLTVLLTIIAAVSASTQGVGIDLKHSLTVNQKLAIKSWVHLNFDARTYALVDKKFARSPARDAESITNTEEPTLIFHRLHSATPLELELMSRTQKTLGTSRDAHLFLSMRNQFTQDSERFLGSIVDFIQQKPTKMSFDSVDTLDSDRSYCMLSKADYKILAWKQKGASYDILKIEPNDLLDGVFEQYLVLQNQDQKSAEYITNRRNSDVSKTVFVRVTEHEQKVTFLIKGQKTTFQLLCSDPL